MKLPVSKIKRELVKNHNWYEPTLNSDANKELVFHLISDTLKIVDKILKEQKEISIK